MAKLFGINRPNTNLRKNVFDLSSSTTFSMSAGMLIPTLVREVNPGEKVELSLASITRSQPLNTAAFVKIRQYYHAFFVPYKQLWSPWDNFINGVDYRQSTRQMKAGESIPAFSFHSLLTQLFKAGILAGRDAYKGNFSLENATDALGYSYVYGISRLLDMLGYGIEITFRPTDYVPSWRADGKHNDVVIPDVGRYPYSHGGRSQAYKPADKPATGKPATPPHPPRPADGYISPQPDSDVKIRIASFADFCDFVFNNSSSFFTGSVTDGVYTTAPAIADKLKTFIYDCFGYYKFNPFRLLAYQKIYYDFYRRQDYEPSRPEHYNIDDINSADLNISDNARLLGIFTLRYRWLAKDYFTGVVPSELFGTENLANPNSVNVLLPEYKQAMTNLSI